MDFFHDPAFQQSVVTLFLALVTLLTGVLGRGAVGVINVVKNDKKNTFFMTLVDIAVQAAEQGKFAGLVDDRKAAATASVQTMLTHYGILGVTAEQISAAIEASVWTQFGEIKEAVETPPVAIPVEVTVASA